MWSKFGVLAVVISQLLQTDSATGAGNAGWDLPPIKVVDEAGQPLPQSEVTMRLSDSYSDGFGFKQADPSGEVSFRKSDYYWPSTKAEQAPEGEYKVLVLSRGRAPVETQWALPTTSPLTVQVPAAGSPVEVSLKSADGQSIPTDLIPRFYPEDFRISAWPDNAPNGKSMWPEVLSAGKYRIHVKQTTAPWQMQIQHQRFLQGYDISFETTGALEKGKVDYTLPAPGTIDFGLSIAGKDKGTADSAVFEYEIAKRMRVDGRGYHATIIKTTGVTTAQGTTQTINNLAPGDYVVSIAEGTEEMRQSRDRMPLFYGNKNLSLNSGEEVSIALPFETFDPGKLKGSSTALIKVLKLDGSPAANMSVQVKYLDPDMGYYTLTSGTLTDQGTTVIENLAGGGKEAPVFRLYDNSGERGSTIGSFRLDTAETSRTFTYKLAPKSGDTAPDITLTDLNTSQPVKLSDFRGQVVFLDFWATWCGPCQEPMAHNQKMMAENEAHWKDKVIIIGASIDEEAQTAINHVKKNGWEKVRHLWCGEEAWGSSAAKTYGVNSVPTALLIDKEGKITWRGHPAAINVEEETAKLLE